MKNRTIILLLSVFLFGMAFGCNPLSSEAEDYMLAIQHTTEHDILIVDTELDDKGGTLDVCTAELIIDGAAKSFNSDDGDMECAIVSDSERGWFAIKLDKGALPAASGALKIKIGFSYKVEDASTEQDSDETPMLDITKAKEYPIKLLSSEWEDDDSGYSKYQFALSLPSSASNVGLNSVMNMLNAMNLVAPLPGAECAADKCTFSFDTHAMSVSLKLVRAVRRSGSVSTPITPLLYAIGCIQTPAVVGKDGASICLPAKSTDLSDCEADPTAEGCEVDPDDSVDPNDPDQDGITGEEDKCPDQAEIYTFSSLRPADGVLDGCPDSDSIIDPDLDEGEEEFPGMGNDGSGCSLNPAAASNSGGLLLSLMALAYIMIRRKR